MFESAELGNKIDKQTFEAELPQLRVDLINAQYDLNDADFSVVLLLMGDDRWGCSEVLDAVQEWMDARYIETHVLGDPTGEERQRPEYWRYWRALPPKGKMGIFAGAWALRAIVNRVDGVTDEAEYRQAIDNARRFVQTLVDDGTLLLKFWVHLPKREMKKRLKKASDEPAWRLRLDENERDLFERYDEIIPVAEQYVRSTDDQRAPWHVIESTDDRYRDLTIAKIVHAALSARLHRQAPPAPPTVASPDPPEARGSLSTVDLTKTIEHDEYRKQLRKSQTKLAKLVHDARKRNVSSVFVFEGWDAAGKGGVIRRITRALFARDYKVIPVAAPTDEEKARHYLWRFWRHLPPAGRMLIFDRSWYGRVLVERVEGFAPEHDWRRAYSEINDFEAQLVEHGMAVCKFWLHIDQDEQLRRFKAREETPYKKHKITEEDFRNRERWDDYVAAVNEMVARTSTEIAPWHLVSANDKRWARLQVLDVVSEQLKIALKSSKKKG